MTDTTNRQGFKTQKSAAAAAKKLYGANWDGHAEVYEEGGVWNFRPKTVEPEGDDKSNGDDLAAAAQALHNSETQNPGENAEPQPESAENPAPWNGTGQPPSMMAGLVHTMMNGVPEQPKVEVPKPEAGTGTKIEKDRPEQNGIKRPSKGSTCAIIWDTCDRITAENGTSCTSGQLHEALKDYNEFTLRTQYARWRAFNGITGRLPNQSKAGNSAGKIPDEFQDVKENLQARLDPENAAALESLAAVTNPNELVVWMATNFINF